MCKFLTFKWICYSLKITRYITTTLTIIFLRVIFVFCSFSRLQKKQNGVCSKCYVSVAYFVCSHYCNRISFFEMAIGECSNFYSASALLAMLSAVLAIVNLSDRLSDHLSQAGIKPKRPKLRSRGLHWRIAP